MTEQQNVCHLPALSAADEGLLQNNMGQLAMIQGNVQSSSRDVKTIYVTSCFNQEGKTRAAIEMAHGLAINDARVLLVDGNPRNPALHGKYNMADKPGLMDVLFLETELTEAAHTTKYPHLSVMPFGEGPEGRPNMLRDKALAKLLASVGDRWDFVVMDGHSQMGSSDAPIIASMFDGTAIVVECEKTKWEVVQSATRKITSLGGQPLGLILNKRRYYVPDFLYGQRR